VNPQPNAEPDEVRPIDEEQAMHPNSYQDAEIAYRRARITEAFRAGSTRAVSGGRHHHLPLRRHAKHTGRG
jgi:hypothetical protein